MRKLISAGGVVVAPTPQGPRVAVLHHQAWDEWRLPKGKLKEGESAEEAAVREVAEELGVRGEIVARLGSISYGYSDPDDGEHVEKQVTFYLMSAPEVVSDFIEAKTFDEVRWLSLKEAEGVLTFAGEGEMVARAGRVKSAKS